MIKVNSLINELLRNSNLIGSTHSAIENMHVTLLLKFSSNQNKFWNWNRTQLQ